MTINPFTAKGRARRRRSDPHSQRPPTTNDDHRRVRPARPTSPPTDEDLTLPSTLRTVESVTSLLDTRFRIPGTNLRFGADFLLGLVPGAGDALSLGISGLLILAMARHGASGGLIVKMLGNVLLDAIVGSIPIFGNVFDLFYKANVRNLQLMREYHVQQKHRGPAWPWIALTAAVILVALIATLTIVGLLVRWGWEILQAAG